MFRTETTKRRTLLQELCYLTVRITEIILINAEIVLNKIFGILAFRNSSTQNFFFLVMQYQMLCSYYTAYACILWL